MTEATDSIETLPAPVERFVLQWGDMGSQWGVNRSISQIHALLYLSEKPRTAEDIAGMLGIARSNVSNSLKDLLSFNLIRRVPVKGDRRDHFEAETDVWEIAAHIAAIRKQREIDPALAALRACAAEAGGDKAVHPIALKRLKDMLQFTQTMDSWFTQMQAIPRTKLAALIRLGARIVRYLPLGGGN